MSQKFWNLRRCSEPTSSIIKQEGKHKIVTLANAIPAITVSPKPSCEMPTSTGEEDEVAYRRNTSKLIEEFQKKNSDNSLVTELLHITQKRRREFINSCQERTITPVQKFHFLASKRWLSLQ